MHDLLEQLDDPVPFEVSPDLVTRAKARGTRLRRRRRLGVTGMAIPVIVVLALVAGAVYVDHRLDQVQRVDVGEGVLAPVVAGEPFNVLVVGTEGRRGDDATRSDTIMVVHVDRSAARTFVLTIPRDLVFAGATSGNDRINSVLPRGGPSALITTIHDQLGIDIAHYVEIDFDGFVRLIDAAGGISVRPTAPLRDATTGLQLDTSCQHLDGEQTLALARSRHLEYDLGQSVGYSGPPRHQWESDSSGDAGRIERQQLVMYYVLHKLQAMPTDVGTLDTLVDVLADNTTVDAGFDRSAMLSLAQWGRTLDSEALAFETLPTSREQLADGSEVLVPTSDAAATIDSFGRSEFPKAGLPSLPAPPYGISGC